MVPFFIAEKFCSLSGKTEFYSVNLLQLCLLKTVFLVKQLRIKKNPLSFVIKISLKKCNTATVPPKRGRKGRVKARVLTKRDTLAREICAFTR